MIVTKQVLKDEYLLNTQSSFPYGQVLSPDAAEAIAVQVAYLGSGFVSPNPLVGAVLLDEAQRLIGVGAHLNIGQAHAEVNAVEDAKKRGFGANIAKSVLYSTLEPCAHQGRTPSCAAMLSSLNLKQVVVGCLDPNPLVNGKGIERLKGSGASVNRFSNTGQLECKRLAEIFLHGVTHPLPFVGMKVASSLNGVMAKNGDQRRWLTSERARQYGHYLRLRYDAIMIGADTLIKDDPTLDVRAPFFRTRIPKRIVLDPKLRGYENRREPAVLKKSQEDTVWICATASKTSLQTDLRAQGAQVITIEAQDERFDVRVVLEQVKKLGCQSVLLEGGGRLYSGFLQKNLVNRLHCFSALRLCGSAHDVLWGTGLATEIDKPLQDFEITAIEQEILIEGLLSST